MDNICTCGNLHCVGLLTVVIYLCLQSWLLVAAPMQQTAVIGVTSRRRQSAVRLSRVAFTAALCIPQPHAKSPLVELEGITWLFTHSHVMRTLGVWLWCIPLLNNRTGSDFSLPCGFRMQEWTDLSWAEFCYLYELWGSQSEAEILMLLQVWGESLAIRLVSYGAGATPS